MTTIYYKVPFVWLLLKVGVYSSVAFIPLASLLVATNYLAYLYTGLPSCDTRSVFMCGTMQL